MINEADPERFPLLRKAVELLLAGTHTPLEALEVLNHDWGYRTRKTKRTGGNELSKSTWYKILSNPLYCGDLSGRKNVKEGQQTSFPSLMSDDEFGMIQVLLGNKATRRQTRKEWPYNGEIVCEDCGSAVITEEKWQIICPQCKTKFHKAKKRTACINCGLAIEKMKKPKILHYKWLRCCKSKTLPNGKRCSQKSVPVNDFEGQIDNLLEQIEIPEKFNQWAIKWLQKLNKEEVKERTNINKSLQSFYNDTQKQIYNLLHLRIKGLIDDEEYAHQKEVLLLEKKEVKDKLENTDKRANKWLELSEKTFHFATYARYWFVNGTNEQKRGILQTLGSNLTLNDQKVLINLDEPFMILKKFKENEAKSLEKLEHIESVDLLGNIEAYATQFPNWLPSLDSNQD